MRILYTAWIVLVATLVALVLPVLTFLTNRDVYNFSIGELLVALVVPAAILAVGLFLILFVGAHFRIVGYRLHLLALSIVLALVLEFGLLAFGLPILDGTHPDFHKFAWRITWDTLLLASLIAIPQIYYQAFQRRIILLGTLTVFLALLPFADSSTYSKLPPKRGERSIAGSGKVTLLSRDEAVSSFRYAANRNNTLVLLLDCVDTLVTQEVLAHHPELRESFSGFTQYTNNIGMHGATIYALPSLFTGEYYRAGVAVIDHAHTIFQSPILAYYSMPDHHIAVSIGLVDISFASKTTMTPRPRHRNPLTTISEGIVNFIIPEICAIRSAPWFLKQQILSSALAHRTRLADTLYGKDSSLDDERYRSLSEASSSPTLKKSFNFLHLIAGHPPITLDGEGQPISVFHSNTWEGYRNRVYYELKRTADLFEKLRQRGLYDEMNIILLADHGCLDIMPKPSGNELSRLSPFLWVKPANRIAPLCESAVPTSHSKFANLILQMAEKNLSPQEIDAALTCPERIYSNTINEGTSEETKVSADRHTETRQNQFAENKKTIAAIECDTYYTLNIFKSPYPPFSMAGSASRDTFFIKMATAESPGTITFRFPTASKKYTLNLGLLLSNTSDSHSGSYTLSCNEQLITKIHQEKKQETLILKVTINSDAEGYAVLSFVPNNNPSFQPLITHIKFTAE